MNTLAQQIDALLPQTQCSKCGFDGCMPYAEALAKGETQINRCPPGGEAGIKKIAQLLRLPELPLDIKCGQHQPHRVALIDESQCIGCIKCLEVCPVDAIVGAKKMLHTVIAAHCTGCDLCIPPCPVDCITMVSHVDFMQRPRAAASRLRHQQHQQRGTKIDAEREAALAMQEKLLQRGEA